MAEDPEKASNHPVNVQRIREVTMGDEDEREFSRVKEYLSVVRQDSDHI